MAAERTKLTQPKMRAKMTETTKTMGKPMSISTGIRKWNRARDRATNITMPKAVKIRKNKPRNLTAIPTKTTVTAIKRAAITMVMARMKASEGEEVMAHRTKKVSAKKTPNPIEKAGWITHR